MSNPVDSVTGLWYQPSGSEEQTLQQQQQQSFPPHNNRTPSRSDGADWADLIPLLLRHGYRNGLNVHRDSWDYPLLLCERSYNPPPLRQQVLEILMEDLQVSSVFLAKDAVMQCYACGRTQGTVVDMGYGGTTVTPVYEGYVEPHGIQRAPIGLSHTDWRVLEHMEELSPGFLPLYQVKQQRDFGWSTAALQRRAPAFHEASRLFLAQECRLTGAAIDVDTTTGSSSTNTTSTSVSFQAPSRPFQLPDGTEIQIGCQFRFQSSSILLGRPQIVVSNAEGATATTSVATTTEQDARQRLFQKNKQGWMTYIQQQQQALEKVEQQQASNAGDLLNPENVQGEFTDATAVGIAKRRTKRQKLKDQQTQMSPVKLVHDNKTSFSNSRLTAACTKYFQTLVEQSLTPAPIAQMICESAYKCDRDQQPALLGNIILGGGGSCLGPTEQAVPDLLKEQTESLIHTHTPGWRVKLLAPAVAERSVLPWLGGSILASLGSFHEMYVTKADYEEWGSAIVNRKCP